MNNDEKFEHRNKIKIHEMGKDNEFLKISKKWLQNSIKHEYSYHFRWLGLPIIQYPQDILAIQELIWKVKPDIIIETGVARGGSLILSASILEIIGKGQVIGIDIDIHKHNRKAIEKHNLSKRIKLIQGSSIDSKVIEQIKKISKNKKNILVFLDSNHTFDHVLNELNLYSKFVKKDSYIVVFDTLINDIPDKMNSKRIWGKKNNPKLAVKEFLKNNSRFKIDEIIETKLQLTVAPSGYLFCIKN